MRSSLLATFAGAVLLIGGPAAAAPFKVDPSHTSVVFSVDHLGYSSMIGRFSKVAGALEFDHAAVTRANLKVVIDPKSIDTNDAKRDDHLRSPDFFNVAEFPDLTFVSTKVEKTGEKTGKVTGDLTLLGVTRPVTLDVTFNKIAPNPLPQSKGVVTAGFSATGSLRRTDFGMKYAAPALGDTIQIRIEAEAVRAD